MIKIAVMCKDNRQIQHEFMTILHTLRENNITINRLIFGDDIIGTKKCRVRFFSEAAKINFESLIGLGKYDLCMGFMPKYQLVLLKDGCKVNRKYTDPGKDHTNELLKYFLN